MAGLNLKKPRALSQGSRVALVSPSWGGPGTIPHRFDMGVRELRERFGFEVVEMEHTRAQADWVWRNPKARADDLNAAFADPTIDGIIASIGGDDSVRVLPHIDTKVMADNPKVFMGFSDTTTLHVLALLSGLQTFYGPSVMAGIAENGGMFPYTEESFRRTVMSTEAPGDIEPAQEWTCEMVRWEDTSRANERRTMQPNEGRKWLQGSGRVEGHLVGGCLDVLEMLKGTEWWPGPEIWDGAVFYWETSEDGMPPAMVGYILRNYGMLGVFDRIRGMVVGRPDAYTPEQRAALPEVVRRIIADEFGRPDMPVVMDLDFGHTYPQITLPNGSRIVLDPQADKVTLPDPATV